MKIHAALLVLLVSGFGPGGCGQTGPLYLPESRQPLPEQSTPEQPAPEQAIPDEPLSEEPVNENSTTRN